LRLFSFGGYGLALAALALMVFGAIECPPDNSNERNRQKIVSNFAKRCFQIMNNIVLLEEEALKK